MDRDKIRATIEGLERIVNGQDFRSTATARDALTLLRILSGRMAGDGKTTIRTWHAFADIDRERKAAGHV